MLWLFEIPEIVTWPGLHNVFIEHHIKWKVKIKPFLFCFNLSMFMEDLQSIHQILIYWGDGRKAGKCLALGQIIKQRSRRQTLNEEFMRDFFHNQCRIASLAHLQSMLLPSLSKNIQTGNT